jgi:hypothetical protein
MPSTTPGRIYIQAEIHSSYNVVHSACIEIHPERKIEEMLGALKHGIDQSLRDIGAYG